MKLLPTWRKTVRARLVPLYALGVAGVWLADPTPAGLALGLALVVAGEAVRSWGAGHLVKNDRLTVTGPYAWVRHPLYLGSLLIGAGFLLMGGGPALWLLPGALLFFFLYYFPYKDRIESARLERLYGPPYARYRAAVPALLPVSGPWPEAAAVSGGDRRWSADCFRDNDEAGTLAAVVIGTLVLLARAALPSG
jgi:protein-S-isoprenylcysteine O-methyltransferase Ste14